MSVEPKDPNKPLEDVITVKVKTWGLTARPGFFYNAVNNDIGLDLKIGYWNRTGIGLSPLAFRVGTTSEVVIAPQVSLSYRLDHLSQQVLMNTELYIGYRLLTQAPVAGLRINL